jgi:hypothetical protein
MSSNGWRVVSGATNKKIAAAAKVKTIGNKKPLETWSKRFCAISPGIVGAKLKAQPISGAGGGGKRRARLEF